VKLLQPLRIVHVALAARDMLDVARIHEEHLEAPSLEHLEDGNPVHPCRLHRDCGDAHGLEPIRQSTQLAAERAEGAHRLFVAISGDRDHMKRRPDIETSGIGVDRR
jgi:hypothetical protein